MKLLSQNAYCKSVTLEMSQFVMRPSKEDPAKMYPMSVTPLTSYSWIKSSGKAGSDETHAPAWVVLQATICLLYVPRHSSRHLVQHIPRKRQKSLLPVTSTKLVHPLAAKNFGTGTRELTLDTSQSPCNEKDQESHMVRPTILFLAKKMSRLGQLISGQNTYHCTW